MSFEVNVATVQQYTTIVQHLLQQKGSRFRDTVTMNTYTGKAAKSVEQVGAVTAQKRTSRHQDTPLISTPHDARWVFPADFEWADLIDDVDKLRMLIDPTGPYAMNGAFALGRAMDDEVILSFFGDSKTGENGTDTTVFDTANQTIIADSKGLTVDKLIEARKILRSNEVDFEFDRAYVALTAVQSQDLIKEAEVKNIDFNSVKPLVNGEVTQFMGFTVIHSERLPVDGSADRRVPVWVKSGIHLGMWNDVKTRISERGDKSYSTQVFASGTFGATRTEEGKVVEILCVE